MDYCKVCIVGRLVDDVSFTNGNPEKNVDDRAWMRVAVNRPGKGQATCDVFNVVAWGPQARVLRDYCRKGKEVLVEGPGRFNNKKRADGGWDNYFEISAKEIILGHDPQPKTEQPAPQQEKGMQDLKDALKDSGIKDAGSMASLIAQAIMLRREQEARKEQQGPNPDDFPM
jgi:single-stranded DNA-binding protein